MIALICVSECGEGNGAHFLFGKLPVLPLFHPSLHSSIFQQRCLPSLTDHKGQIQQHWGDHLTLAMWIYQRLSQV